MNGGPCETRTRFYGLKARGPNTSVDEGVIIKRHGLIAFAGDVFSRAIYAHHVDNYQNVNPFYHRSWCNLSGERELVIISPFMSIDFRQFDFQVHRIVQFAPRGGINYSEPYHSIKSGEAIFSSALSL